MGYFVQSEHCTYGDSACELDVSLSKRCCSFAAHFLSAECFARVAACLSCLICVYVHTQPIARPSSNGLGSIYKEAGKFFNAMY